MTTTRAPYITRRWTATEEATLRSLVEAGMDARAIGKELNRSFMSIQARVKKLNLTVFRLRNNSQLSNAAPVALGTQARRLMHGLPTSTANRAAMAMIEPQPNDLLIATVAGLLAYMITLGLRAAFGT